MHLLELALQVRGIRMELARVGNNVNQLARRTNAGDDVDLAPAIAELDELNDRLTAVLHRLAP